MGLSANLADFQGMLDETAPAILNGEEMVHYIPDRNNFQMQYWMMRGRKMSDVLSSGDELRRRIKASSGAQAGFYSPSKTEHNPQMPDDGSWVTSYWAFHMGRYAYQIEPLMINAGSTSRSARTKQTWVNTAWDLLQSLKVKVHESLDDSYFAKPDYGLMGGTDPRHPVSIHAILNGFKNGLFNPGSNVGSVWPELFGMAPSNADFARFKPRVFRYGDGVTAGGTGFTPGHSKSIIRSLASAFNKTGFRPPVMDKEFFTPESAANIPASGGFVACSDWGLSSMATFYANSNANWDDLSDPHNFPKYRGVPFVYVATLDDTQAYPVMSAGTDEDVNVTNTDTEIACTITGPRFFGINPDWMRIYWHESMFLELLPLLRLNQTGYEQAVLSCLSQTCHDRQMHFFLAPKNAHTIP